MRVVLGEATHTGQAVHHAGLFVAVVVAHFEQAQRQFTVGTAARTEDQVVHRAVHGLEVVLLAGLNDVAFSVTFLISQHGREHGVSVVRQVPGGVEQAALRNFGGVHKVETGLLVTLNHIGLDFMTQNPALGVENHQAGANFLRERVQV